MSSHRIPAALLGAALTLGAALPAHAAPVERPDLRPVKLAGVPSAAVQPGAKLKLAIRVRNAGGRPSVRSLTGLFISKNRKRDAGDRRVARLRTTKVRAHRAARLRKAVTLPKTLKPGTYRLIVCVDLRHKVREGHESDNCRVVGKRLRIRGLSLSPEPPNVPAPHAPAPEPAPGPPSLALHLDDGFDWGNAENAAGHDIEPGEVVTLTARMAAGVPGAAGYTRTTEPDAPFVTGKTAPLAFSNLDDGTSTATLPFAMPFAGVPYAEGSASTNGWLGFGAAATDYWDDNQNEDFRGIPGSVGRFQRGIMPFWIDGDLKAEGTRPAGSVKVVDPGDGERFAVQWDINSHMGLDDLPRRTSQAVLFRDGRVRFDYKGDRSATTSEDDEGFVGLSGGTGPSSLDTVVANTLKPPSGSILYTPRPVSSSPATAGKVAITLPYGSTFVSADAGCSLVTAPTKVADGLVECATPAVPAGTSIARQVRYTQPALLTPTDPANTDTSARWSAGGHVASDTEELAPSLPYRETTPNPALAYKGPAESHIGDDLPFDVTASLGSIAMRRPKLTFTVPPGLKLKSTTLPEGLCHGAPATSFSGGTLTCTLASGTRSIGLRHMTFVASTVGTFTVKLRQTAQNITPGPKDTVTASAHVVFEGP